MASEVDICNLALGRLGDSALVNQITPPEASVQSRLCSRFYPVARDSLLEMHEWGFATRRATLALLDDAPVFGWSYAYGWPTNAIKVFAVLPEGATADYATPLSSLTAPDTFPVSVMGVTQPKRFATESVLETGDRCILTDVENANARYIVRETDTGKFSPLFVDCLAWLLASYLAGPIYKGETGVGMGRSCLQAFAQLLPTAKQSDASQQQREQNNAPVWLANR